MTTKTILKTFLLALALAALNGCASYGSRVPTAGATAASAPSSNPELNRFFTESDRASRPDTSY